MDQPLRFDLRSKSAGGYSGDKNAKKIDCYRKRHGGGAGGGGDPQARAGDV